MSSHCLQSSCHDVEENELAKWRYLKGFISPPLYSALVVWIFLDLERGIRTSTPNNWTRVLKEFDNKTVFNYAKRQWLRTKNTSFRWEVNFLGLKWRTSESSTNINGRIRKYVRTGGEENSFHTVSKHTYSDSWAYNEVLREILMFNHFSRLNWYELTQIWNKWVITS